MKAYFELVGSGMVHRALLRVVAHKKIIGVQDAARTEVGTEEMNLMTSCRQEPMSKDRRLPRCRLLGGHGQTGR